MAKNKRTTVTIDIGGDPDEFKKAIKQAYRAHNSAKKRMQRDNDDLEKDADKTTDEIVSHWRKAARQMRTAMRTANRRISLDNNKITQQIAGQTRNLLGGAVLAGGAAVGLGIAKSITDGLDLAGLDNRLKGQLGISQPEAERLARIAAAAYTDGWGSELAEVGDVTKKLYRTLDGENLADSALEAFTRRGLAFVDAFEVDMSLTSKAIAGILSNDLAGDGVEAFDLLTYAMQKNDERGADLIETFEEYSNQFALAGLTGEEAMVAMSRALKGGARATDGAADAIKESFLLFTNGAETSREAVKLVGLDYADLEKQINAGFGTAAFDEVLKALVGLETQTDRSAAAQALFGGTFEQVGLGGIEAMAGFTAETANVSGAIDQLVDDLSGDPRQQVNAFIRDNLAKMTAFIANEAIPALRDLWPSIKPFVDGFTEFAQSDVVNFITDALGWFSENEAATAGALTALAIIVGGPLVVAFATWAATTWAATWPLLAVAAAVGLLVAGAVWAYQEFELFRRVIDAVGGFLRDHFWTILKVVGVAIGVWLLIPFGLVISTIGLVVGAIWLLWPTIKDVAARLVGKIGEMADWITEKLGDMVGWIEEKLDGFVDWIGGIPGAIKDKLTGLWDPISEGLGKVLGKVGELFGNFSITMPSFNIPGIGEIGGFELGFSTLIPGLATGGVVRDEGIYRLADYPGSRSDPEIATPQSILAETTTKALTDALRATGGQQPLAETINIVVPEGRDTLAELRQTEAAYR